MEPRLQQYQLGKYNENAEMQSTYGTVDILNASLASPEIGRHTSELQSRQYLVCRLLLEKKKKKTTTLTPSLKHMSNI